MPPSSFLLVVFGASIIFSACGAVSKADTQQKTAAQEPQHGLICKLKNQAVTESSGVAASRRDEGIYWTHNDSGDGPNLYAFDLQGNDMGTFTLADAQAIDWEDMASALVDGKPFLYVGDIGDNALARKNIQVYRVREPEPAPGINRVDDYETYTLTYPDGPHDCETLMVAPTGDIQVVTKSSDGVSKVYGVASPAKSGTYALKKLGEIRMEADDVRGRFVTGGDMAADGKRLVLRTYSAAYLYEGEPSRWFTAPARRLEIAVEAQGEGVCFDYRPGRLITTSEGVPCPVSFARLPR